MAFLYLLFLLRVAASLSNCPGGVWCFSEPTANTSDSTGSHVGGNEPCLSYTVLDDVHRSTAYVMGDAETGLCDSDLAQGWYRFNSTMGTTIPEQCVEQDHCGTVVPIWMNGAHPTVADGIVTRQACANLGTPGNCCDRYLNIRVKNCGHYFVYYLYPAPSCPMAYCAGSLQPCPRGQWSPTGLNTGCKDVYPLLSTDPVLEGPVVTQHSFSFNCVLDFSAQNNDVEMQVTWTFDGQEDVNIPSVLMTPGGGRYTASLDGALLRGHLGHDVGCKVRSSYVMGPDVKSEWHYSNVYRTEIKVEPARITVSEDGTDQNITVTSTVPVLCRFSNSNPCVTIQLDVSGPKDNIFFPTPCIYQLKSTDWNDNTKSLSTIITVSAVKDNLNEENRHMIISFRPIFAFGDPYTEVFHDYQIPYVQVVVEDSPVKTCRITTQLHITGFTGNNFQLTDAGVYTMYRHQGVTSGDEFELQVHTFPCSAGLSCICGVAIRDRQDVIRLEGCSHLRSTPSLDVPTTPLREGTVIQRSTDGRKTVIYFPSGREVKVDTVYWSASRVNNNNVQLVVPGADIQGHGAGICGTLDHRVPNDVYVHRNGTWDSTHAGGRPVSFEESWSVDIANSWFEIEPPRGTSNEDNRYCQCDFQSGDNRLNCSVAADTYVRVQHCEGMCLPPREHIWPDHDWIIGRRSINNNHDEHDPAVTFTALNNREKNLHWPTPRGITETRARHECLQEIQKSQLWSHCHYMSSVLNTILDICITDVLHTDSYDMVESALASFTSQCQSELSLDPRNYVTNTEGQSVMLPELTNDVCSPSCLRHGYCVRGTCVCDTGYVGDNCQLDATKGPQLLSIRGSKYCDTNERTCRMIYFDAENFQMGDGFLCKSQEIRNEHENTTSTTTHLEAAIFINSNCLACIIPDARTKTDKWLKSFSVSVTNDADLYGNPMTVTVYDSTCYTCTDVAGCMRKPNTCLIDNLCYRDGDYKPGDATQRCVTSHSETTWFNI